MIDTSMIDEILESLLFLSGNGLKVADVATQLEVKTADVNAAVKRLKEKYGGKSGIHLLSLTEKFSLRLIPHIPTSWRACLTL